VRKELEKGRTRRMQRGREVQPKKYREAREARRSESLGGRSQRKVRRSE
jgi:hypothetical protein